MENKLIFKIFTDGGARGNPGPAAVGIVIEGPGVNKKYGEYIGETTNNEAEYRAAIIALKKLKQLLGGDKTGQATVEFYVDSELLSKQLNSEYKIKEKNLQNLFMELWNLKLDFGRVTFNHVFREENKEADKLVNEALDNEAQKQKLL
ncbi:MAG: hypothetical protein A3J46_00315 [Candidatus Yanofskybacteria bacterium RIFCSPHIGHO2_02_FULL_41_11]|uniref:RNase H type-1 domain-containing protein n=1 Tax=Candidatus Yanofskybacteria bacterium RIFCSPHIGHO2_02_FULL_41_11 TaxID=1802675 RepID=A0A1F8FB61_9BACT|nr:MAG: hypothetical protein A3J46_00315 [Candidatus Yanofskybacteria bacterium RIFCSPHIGHO2_02_FULL_41_11]